MAWSNIQKEMMDYFQSVAKGVRDDMDSNMTHIIEYEYSTVAKGFARAAKDIAGPNPNYTREFKVAIAELMDPWQKGGRGLVPGDVFRTVRMTKLAGGGTKDIPMENAKVIGNLSTLGQKCTLTVLSAGKFIKPSTLNAHIREEVWKNFNKNRGKGSQIKYDKTVVPGATPFAHDQQSTVGLKQMHKLGDSLQDDMSPENPFVKADAFVGQMGRARTISMDKFVESKLIGEGASTQFSKEWKDGIEGGELIYVVKGKFSGKNFPGSEVTDKLHFNRYIKKYFEETFLDHFDARTKSGKETMKAMGYKTAADFRGSKTVREVKREEVINKVGIKLSKKSKNITAKVPKKKKDSKSKKTFKSKNTKSPKYKTTTINGTKKGTKRKKKRSKVMPRLQRASHSPIALQQLLNKALPEELMKNMTGVYPRSLEYRTGRFAQSAEVTSIVPFPKMTQIQYTYMKDPYQVFEPGSGSPLATSGRDPRQIIGGTIRELAQSIMGTKFGLVRTKRV